MFEAGVEPDKPPNENVLEDCGACPPKVPPNPLACWPDIDDPPPLPKGDTVAVVLFISVLVLPNTKLLPADVILLLKGEGDDA